MKSTERHLTLLKPPVPVVVLKEGEEQCTKCKNVTRHIAKVNGKERLCKTCYRNSKPKEECPLCKNLSNDLCTSPKYGIAIPVCKSCRTKDKEKMGIVLCQFCKKHRKDIGLYEDGKPICQRCHDLGGSAFICPKCGNNGLIYNATMCRKCYLEGLAYRKTIEYAAELKQQWVRDAYLAFMKEMTESNANEGASRASSYIRFFATIDDLGLQPHELTLFRMVDIFKVKGLRGYSLPYSYLKNNGIVPDYSEAEKIDAYGTERLNKNLQSAEGKWFKKVVDDFARYLLDKQDTHRKFGNDNTGLRWLSSNTIANYVRYAVGFLHWCEGISSTFEISPYHLGMYFKKYPGLKSCLAQFLMYLWHTKQTLIPYRRHKFKRQLTNKNFLSDEKIRELKKAWLEPIESDLRWATYGLLIFVYVQRPVFIVKIKLSDISTDENGWMKIRFQQGKDVRFLEVMPKVAAIINRYIQVRKSCTPLDNLDRNPYLFPGVNIGAHMSTDAFKEYLRDKHDVGNTQLYQTGLWRIIKKGIKNPGSLVEELGISPRTAMDMYYLQNNELKYEVNMLLSYDE